MSSCLGGSLAHGPGFARGGNQPPDGEEVVETTFKEGEAGLLDRSSRPRRSPRKLAPSRKQLVAELRRKHRRTALALAELTGIPRSTFGRVLRRHRLSRARDLEPKPVIVRYERQAPGKLIHLDIKKLGRIDGVGHRIHGDRTRRARGVGWEYAHVAIDDFSRLS